MRSLGRRDRDCSERSGCPVSVVEGRRERRRGRVLATSSWGVVVLPGRISRMNARLAGLRSPAPLRPHCEGDIGAVGDCTPRNRSTRCNMVDDVVKSLGTQRAAQQPLRLRWNSDSRMRSGFWAVLPEGLTRHFDQPFFGPASWKTSVRLSSINLTPRMTGALGLLPSNLACTLSSS